MTKTRQGKKDIESYIIRGTNEIVKAGDCVLMRPSDNSKPPYVACVEKIEQDNRNNVRVRVRWYYRPEESIGGRRQFQCFMELRNCFYPTIIMMLKVLTSTIRPLAIALENQDVRVIGVSHGWITWYYVFQFFYVVLLFTIIILIGVGWCFLKPFLQNRENNVLMIVISLQHFTSVASVVVGENRSNFKQWIMLSVIDLLSCCSFSNYLVNEISWEKLEQMKELLKISP